MENYRNKIRFSCIGYTPLTQTNLALALLIKVFSAKLTILLMLHCKIHLYIFQCAVLFTGTTGLKKSNRTISNSKFMNDYLKMTYQILLSE